MHHTVYFFDGFQLDVTRRKLISSGGLVLSMSSRAMDALLLLVANAGQLVEKRRLMETVWPNAVVEDNNLNQCILSIRRALGETAGTNRYVMTEPGRGYRFVCPVSTANRESATVATVEKGRPRYIPIMVSAAVIAAIAALAIPRLTRPPIPSTATATTDMEGASPAIILRLREMAGKGRQPQRQTSAALLRCLSQRPGMKLRVVVQLVPDGTDTPLWSGEYSAGRGDVLNMQEAPARDQESTCRTLIEAGRQKE